MRRISTRGLSDFYLEVLQILVDAWPEARTRKSPSGYLPLDCATKIPRETILPVLVENPQEAMQYYFKHGGRKIETVDWLLHRNLGALAESDGDGNLPLHCAVLSAGTPRIVLNLMQAFPLAVCMRNRRGKLPLHIAAQHSRDPQVVELLARVAPLLIGEKDGEGWLPFQLAAQNCSRATSVGFRRVAFLCPGLEMTYHLLRKSPDTLQSQGDDDE
eukprot:Sro1716_g293190.2  (216) ;mRNA; f:15800-16447